MIDRDQALIPCPPRTGGAGKGKLLAGTLLTCITLLLILLLAIPAGVLRGLIALLWNLADQLIRRIEAEK